MSFATVGLRVRRAVDAWRGAAPVLPIVLCIDAEPDPRVLARDGAPPWRGFEATLTKVAAWRRRLRSAGGGPARFAWFLRMDPQIELCFGDAAYVVRRFGTSIRQLERAGDEIGLHVHAPRWSEERGQFVVDHGDPDWISHCVRAGLQAFRSAMGRPCRSFRFGDGWASQATMDQLSAAGVGFELTAEPEAPARPCLVPGEALYTGSLPGWPGIPRRPYQPAAGDYLRAGPDRPGSLWIIPMSAGVESPGDRRSVSRTLNLTLEPPLFRRIAAENLDRADCPYLGLMVRTSVALEDEAWAVAQTNLDSLRALEAAPRMRWTRPDELVAALGL